MPTLREATKPREPRREMKVLTLGLPRTGSASMTEALTMLGYQDIYHFLTQFAHQEDYLLFDRAADSLFPSLPSYTGKPFTRDDWDLVFGSCEGAADAASFFAVQLIEAYPEAKVILVERDFDQWYKSITSTIDDVWSWPTWFSMNVSQPLLGLGSTRTIRKMFLGFCEAKNGVEVRRNLRTVYDRHHRQIKELVPPERLLVCKLGDGWEPVCKFLDKPVPDAEFPRINEIAYLKALMAESRKRTLQGATIVVLPWVVSAVAAGGVAWMMAKRPGGLGRVLGEVGLGSWMRK